MSSPGLGLEQALVLENSLMHFILAVLSINWHPLSLFVQKPI